MMRRVFLCLALAIGPALSACTQFPELDHTQTDTLETAEYPDLVPLEPLLARASAPGPDPDQTQTDVTARLAGLRGRADAIRGSVLSGAERKRLEEGLR